MFILTRKLVDTIISISNTKTRESYQSFSLILLLFLPTTIPIEQYCNSCNLHTESLSDKWQAGVPTGKQESERLYSSLISHGYPSCFFSYITLHYKAIT